MFKSVGEVFSKLAFPMEENDNWFMQANIEVDDIDEMLLYLQISVDNLVRNRKDLMAADEQLCKALSTLALGEENVELAQILTKLVETHDGLAVEARNKVEIDSQKFSEALHVGLS